MIKFRYLVLIIVIFFTSCNKETSEDIKPITKADLIKGTWTSDHFKMEYFNEAGTKIHEARPNNDLAKVTFDDANATMEYKSNANPKTYPYKVNTINGKTYVDYTIDGGRFYNEVLTLEKNKMVWFGESKGPVNYTDQNGATHQAKTLRTYHEFTR